MKSLGARILLLGVLALPSIPVAQDGGIESLRQTSKAFSAVARKAAPAVVFIQIEGQAQREDEAAGDTWPFHDELFRRFFGEDFAGLARPAPEKPRRPVGQGSGFVFAASGDTTYILTNNHVIEDAGTIRVRFHDGREFEARLQGADPKSDVAVLKIAARIAGPEMG
jgi:serine protease Do